MESEAVSFREAAAESRPEKLCVGVIYLKYYCYMHEPWIRINAVSSSSPGAIQVIVVPL